jgi:thiol:disulfide interchange protein
MEEQQKSTAGQGLGIAGFVLGLIALIISFIPCLGMYALLPGILAIVFSAIALTQANKANASKGLIIAALIISILGTSIAAWQFFALKTAADTIEKYGGEFKNAFEEEFGKDFEEAMKDASKELEKIATELEEGKKEIEEEKPDTIDGGE